jgi:hypothetical protein
VPGNGDGLYRGFVFEGRLDALPWRFQFCIHNWTLVMVF